MHAQTLVDITFIVHIQSPVTSFGIDQHGQNFSTDVHHDSRPNSGYYEVHQAETASAVGTVACPITAKLA